MRLVHGAAILPAIRLPVLKASKLLPAAEAGRPSHVQPCIRIFWAECDELLCLGLRSYYFDKLQSCRTGGGAPTQQLNAWQ